MRQVAQRGTQNDKVKNATDPDFPLAGRRGRAGEKNGEGSDASWCGGQLLWNRTKKGRQGKKERHYNAGHNQNRHHEGTKKRGLKGTGKHVPSDPDPGTQGTGC